MFTVCNITQNSAKKQKSRPQSHTATGFFIKTSCYSFTQRTEAAKDLFQVVFRSMVPTPPWP